MTAKRKLTDAVRSEGIADSLYRLIPKDRRGDFIDFAKSFGMSEKDVRERIRMLRHGKS